MKKVFLMFAAAMAMTMISCNGTAGDGSATDSTAQAAEQVEQPAEAAPAPAEQPASLADIVEKAEGAKWSVDEWKEQFKKALEAYKPFAVAMDKAQPADLEKIAKDYDGYPELIKEFATIAKQSEGGKAIDDAWIQATMEEMQIPHI